VDELERAAPGVVGVRLELLLLAVEEAVRSAVVLDDLVLDAGAGQRGVEGSVVVGGDVRVGARLQRQDRAFDLRGPRNGARTAALARRTTVEAHRAGEAVPGRRRDP